MGPPFPRCQLRPIWPGAAPNWPGGGPKPAKGARVMPACLVRSLGDGRAARSHPLPGRTAPTRVADAFDRLPWPPGHGLPYRTGHRSHLAFRVCCRPEHVTRGPPAHGAAWRRRRCREARRSLVSGARLQATLQGLQGHRLAGGARVCGSLRFGDDCSPPGRSDTRSGPTFARGDHCQVACQCCRPFVRSPQLPSQVCASGRGDRLRVDADRRRSLTGRDCTCTGLDDDRAQEPASARGIREPHQAACRRSLPMTSWMA